MKRFLADMHVHTILSPCGSLQMSPKNIIRAAKAKNIHILGITDHNSTLHTKLMTELGEKENILVLPGSEVNTKEEVHCLTFFENTEIAGEFQLFLDRFLPPVQNDPLRFGDQVVLNNSEEIVEEVKPLLISALEADIYEVAAEVKRLGGLFIPAHIDRFFNSIFSQLGFIPSDLDVDALEISSASSVNCFIQQHPELMNYTIITNSDAHHPENIARAYTLFELERCSFKEIHQALHNKNGRKVIVE